MNFIFQSLEASICDFFKIAKNQEVVLAAWDFQFSNSGGYLKRFTSNLDCPGVACWGDAWLSSAVQISGLFSCCFFLSLNIYVDKNNVTIDSKVKKYVEFKNAIGFSI